MIGVCRPTSDERQGVCISLHVRNMVNGGISINIEVGFIAIKCLVLRFILSRALKIPPVNQFGYMNITGMITQRFIKAREKILV